MFQTRGFAATAADAPLAPFSFERRDPGPRDIRIVLLLCGICFYPMVPGHEIVGRVSEIGSEVRKLEVGDFAGVGCMVDSCRQCAPCQNNLEQFCKQGVTLTYNSLERGKQTRTMGGYSRQIVVDEHFVVKVSANLDLKGVAPLLCAGITTYSPLKLAKIGPGQKVGVIGLGGLGHMGVKFAKAFGAHVVMITTSPEKGADAMRLGADEVLVSTDPDAMAKHAGTFRFLLNTIPVSHDVNPYIALLGIDGAISIVGAPGPLPSVAAAGLLRGRRSLTGSLIGGMAETQEMMDYCSEQGIVSDVETIAIRDVNSAYQRLARNDVRYRFVIDMATLEGS
jgi:uncharacterized zinc-type alcohol dehydrogenase-like protein